MSTATPPPSRGSAGPSLGSAAGRTSAERSSLSVRTLSSDTQTPDEIEAEIEVQREQLAETIDALSARLDVKGQAQAKVEEAKQTAQARVMQVKRSAATSSGRPRPEVLAFGVTVLVATVVLWWRER